MMQQRKTNTTAVRLNACAHLPRIGVWIAQRVSDCICKAGPRTSLLRTVRLLLHLVYLGCSKRLRRTASGIGAVLTSRPRSRRRSITPGVAGGFIKS